MTHNTRERVEEVVKQFEVRMPLITSHGLLLEARLTPTNYEAMKRWLRTTLHQELQKAREDAAKDLFSMDLIASFLDFVPDVYKDMAREAYIRAAALRVQSSHSELDQDKV